MKSLLRPLLVSVVSAAALFAPGFVASAAFPGVVTANWQMDEPPGSPTMTDSSGNGISGAIGDLVVTGVDFPADSGTASRGYHFNLNSGVTPSRRVVVVNEDDRLDPGTGYYSIAMRFRTSKMDSNIVQKGQSETSGGMWKIGIGGQRNPGYIVCHFRDVNHKTKAVRPRINVADGLWHTILCERTETGVAMTIDGVRKYSAGTLGNIDNTYEFAVGGKLKCNWMDVGCDPFVGDIDYITISKG